MKSEVFFHEAPAPPTGSTGDQCSEKLDQPSFLKVKSAVITYFSVWLAYLLIAGGALFIGSSIGVTATEIFERTWDPSQGLTIAFPHHFFALPPDQAFTSLAVLVVVVFTLSATFRDTGVTVEPEVAYVKYRVQAWLLALTGVCCNAIVLMLLIYTVLNWGSTKATFQTALLPLALSSAVAASVLSVGRERQMTLEAMMLHRGILRLEHQNLKAIQRWDRHWAMNTGAAYDARESWKRFFHLCLILSALQFLVLMATHPPELKTFYFLIVVPTEIVFFCILPIFAVMLIVANLLRRMDVLDRLFGILYGALLLIPAAITKSFLFANSPPEVYLPHITLPSLAGLVLSLPLLLPLVRRRIKGNVTLTTYAWLTVEDLQRERELKTEAVRRKRIDKRIHDFKFALESRSSKFSAVTPRRMVD